MVEQGAACPRSCSCWSLSENLVDEWGRRRRSPTSLIFSTPGVVAIAASTSFRACHVSRYPEENVLTLRRRQRALGEQGSTHFAIAFLNETMFRIYRSFVSICHWGVPLVQAPRHHHRCAGASSSHRYDMVFVGRGSARTGSIGSAVQGPRRGHGPTGQIAHGRIFGDSSTGGALHRRRTPAPSVLCACGNEVERQFVASRAIDESCLASRSQASCLLP